jgi:methylated-DNA-[protein]-cysteine S-methyltransferase
MPGSIARARPCFHVIVRSPFGALVVVWFEGAAGPRVRRVLLPDAAAPPERLIATVFEGSKPRSSPEIAKLAVDIRRFLDGRPVQFDLGLADLGACSRFQQRVLVAEHGIPRGWVSTYGRIARHLRCPRASRAVGRALATNPFPIIVPCHRAIKADGGLGGYQAGAEMKRALLALEGVEFDETGKVRAGRICY